MTFRTIAILFYLSTLVLSAPTTCPNNQVYSDCHSPCPRICGEEEAEFCIMSCMSGCACGNGLWLTSEGHCVERESCPVENCETDEDCLEGTFCRQSQTENGCDSENKVCVPYSGVGDRCGGFVMPCYHSRCDPSLRCQFIEGTADIPGYCVEGSDCKEEFNCEQDNCETSYCAKYPSSTCFMDECDEACPAKFVDSCANEVDCECENGPLTCFVDPCSVASCPMHPDARCVSNYCTCGAEFFDENCNQITSCNPCEDSGLCPSAALRLCHHRYLGSMIRGLCEESCGGCASESGDKCVFDNDKMYAATLVALRSGLATCQETAVAGNCRNSQVARYCPCSCAAHL